MTGIELFFFFFLSAGTANYAHTAGDLHFVPRAKQYVGNKLVLDKYEPNPSSLKYVTKEWGRQVDEWRHLRRQKDKNGYWLSPRAM